MARIKFGLAVLVLSVAVSIIGGLPYLIGKATAQSSVPPISLDSPVTFPIDI